MQDRYKVDPQSPIYNYDRYNLHLLASAYERDMNSDTKR